MIMDKEQWKKELEDKKVSYAFEKAMFALCFCLMILFGTVATANVGKPNYLTPMSWFLTSLFFVGVVRYFKYMINDKE